MAVVDFKPGRQKRGNKAPFQEEVRRSGGVGAWLLISAHHRGKVPDLELPPMKYPVTIRGERHYFWRAVDQDGDVIDILVQRRRNACAANFEGGPLGPGAR